MPARYLAGATITPDGAVLYLEMPAPFPDLPEILSEYYFPRDNHLRQQVIGTGGPWRVQDFAAGARVSLRHRRDGRSLRLIAIPPAEDRRAALNMGAVQAAIHLERLDAPVSVPAGVVWHDQSMTLSMIAYLNGFHGVFTDPNARLAANLAINRADLIAQVMCGMAIAANTIVSPWHFGHAKAGLPAIPYDPAAARRLLALSTAPRQVLLRTPSYMPERAAEIARYLADA